MTASLILAQILGAYLTIFSLIMLIRGRGIMEPIKAFANNQAALFLGTVLSLMLGITIVVFHNIWIFGWPLIITLLGWFILIRAILYLLFPSLVEKMIHLFDSATALYISALISLVLGLVLSYYGFFP